MFLPVTSKGNSCAGHCYQTAQNSRQLSDFSGICSKTWKNAEYLTFGFRNKKPNAECSKEVFLKFIWGGGDLRNMLDRCGLTVIINVNLTHTSPHEDWIYTVVSFPKEGMQSTLHGSWPLEDTRQPPSPPPPTPRKWFTDCDPSSSACFQDPVGPAISPKFLFAG